MKALQMGERRRKDWGVRGEREEVLRGERRKGEIKSTVRVQEEREWTSSSHFFNRRWHWYDYGNYKHHSTVPMVTVTIVTVAMTVITAFAVTMVTFTMVPSLTGAFALVAKKSASCVWLWSEDGSGGVYCVFGAVYFKILTELQRWLCLFVHTAFVVLCVFDVRIFRFPIFRFKLQFMSSCKTKT